MNWRSHAGCGLNVNRVLRLTLTLETMVEALKTELDSIKASHPEEAKEIASAVEKAVAHASKPSGERKKNMLELSAKGLKDAAETVKDIAPAILTTAGLIAKFVVGLG